MAKLTGPQKLKMEATGTKFGCHVECSDGGDVINDCVLDCGDQMGCAHSFSVTGGWKRKTRESCRFWLPVDAARQSAANTEEISNG